MNIYKLLPPHSLPLNTHTHTHTHIHTLHSLSLGLLSMVVEPYLDGRLPDIMLVPISISYERTFEEQLFARELLGTPKPKESTGVSQ